MDGGTLSLREKRSSPSFVTFDIYKDDVRADLADVFEGDYDFRLTPQKAETFILAGYHDLADTTGARVKFQITYPPQLLTISYVDDVLTLKF